MASLAASSALVLTAALVAMSAYAPRANRTNINRFSISFKYVISRTSIRCRPTAKSAATSFVVGCIYWLADLDFFAQYIEIY
jgi:hypothetical protein